MRKIVNKVQEVVAIDNIDNSQIVGIKWAGTYKAFVVRDQDGKFRSIGNRPHDFGLANTWHRNSLQEYVETALDQTGTQAFVFDTEKELFKWLSE